MPTYKSAYCESEPDESFQTSAKPSDPPRNIRSSKSSARQQPPPPSYKEPVVRSASANSDSGYSSRTAATSGSSASRSSTARVPRSGRGDANAARPTSRSASVDPTRRKTSKSSGGDARTDRAAPPSAAPTFIRPANSTTCSDQNCQEPGCSMAQRPVPPRLNTGYGLTGSALASPSPHTPYSGTYSTGAYSGHANSTPAPAAVPRRSSSTARPRPQSIADPSGYGVWVPPSPSHSHTAATSHGYAYGGVSTFSTTPYYSSQQYPSQQPTSPGHTRRQSLPRTTSSGTSSRRPMSVIGTTPAYTDPNNPASYSSAPKPPVSRDAPSASHQTLPIRTSSHLNPVLSARNDDPLRGASYSDRDYLNYAGDPQRTIRPQRTTSIKNRPPLPSGQEKAKSTSYYTNSGYNRDRLTPAALERINSQGSASAARGSSRPGRGLESRIRESEAYQKRVSESVPSSSAEAIEQMRSRMAETATSRPASGRKNSAESRRPSISHQRTTSQAGPARGQSRAGSTRSSQLPDGESPLKITLSHNEVEITGDSTGKMINLRTDEHGAPQVTIGSPTRDSREQRYHGGGSTKSGGSFAERMGSVYHEQKDDNRARTRR